MTVAAVASGGKFSSVFSHAAIDGKDGDDAIPSGMCVKCKVKTHTVVGILRLAGCTGSGTVPGP